MSQPQQLTIEQAISRAKKAAKKGNAAKALQLYNAVLQHRPNHPIARKAARKLQKEFPLIQSVQEQAPNPSKDQINALINLYHSGQTTKAERTCRELLQIHPQSLIVINVLGIVLQRLGRLEEALQAFNKAIQLNPDYAEAYSNRGVALQELGRLKEAVQAFDKAIQLKTEFAEAYSSRGVALQELGQLKEAVGSYDKAIQIKPDYAEAYTNRGAALKQLGQLTEAVVAHDRAIRLKPGYAEAHSNRGAALQELGQLEEALQAFDKAIQLKAEFAEAYSNRGVALQELGKLTEAVASCDKAIQLRPGYAEAYGNRGVALQALGQMKEAVESYDKAIQLKPDYAKAYSNRGTALQELGQLNEAVASCNKAIQLKPGYAEAYNNCGAALQELELLKEAVENYDKAIQLKPEYAEAYCNRGAAQQELGLLKEAEESYDKAIQIKPDYARVYLNRGNSLQVLGQLKEAAESYDKAIQFKPNYAEAHRTLSTLKNYKPDDPQIEFMEGLYRDDAEPGKKDRMHICFALAKAYESLGKYDQSFSYLAEGNHLRSNELNYNIVDDKKVITRSKEIFSAGSPAPDAAPGGNASIRTLFIVGMPRSGTSLVEQILASHSQVYGAGELKTMGKLVYPILSNFSDQSVSQDNNKIFRNEINTIRDGYFDMLAELNVPEKIITDKLPLNFLFIGFILSAFPEAKIIHVNRDPMATCWSIYKHYFSGKGNGYAYDMSTLAEFYKLYIDLMSFWRERFPDCIYDLCYENLTESQEEETQKLLQFCGLEFENQCLDFHNTKRMVKTASNVQVRKKMYQGSSEAWRKYERHLQPLIIELGYQD